jgi:endonuclease/exonuclease/phosphatase family metal-dependent hydrolase
MADQVLSKSSVRLRVRKALFWGCGAMASIGVAMVLLVYGLTYHPGAVEPAIVYGGTNAPILRPGQKLRVLTWNVQYMAGKNHRFFYEGGHDERPLPEEIETTLAGVARVIREENPDVVMLQEVDDGSRRTDNLDQVACLLALLPAEYAHHASAFYHKARFIPEPHILGSVGLKLVTLSKYRIREAVRHQLPLVPKDPLTQQFYFKRAILEAHLPVAGGNDFVVLNTHFDAWAAGTGTKARQIKCAQVLMEQLDRAGCSWCFGGDLNLLPPGSVRSRLSEADQKIYDQVSELTPLFDRYPAVPTSSEVGGADFARWLTHFPNGKPEPDRTIDCVVFSPLVKLGEHYVRQTDPGKTDFLKLSDHFPLVVEVTLPP